ncbi:MAG: S1 RNA-binding domain-containing protein [Oculatellaceae cyanobacterium bins.114]|nr:S1 RNA-binding domain-containing protein [Oculatellaceae cyanobacterium bins.114]
MSFSSDDFAKALEQHDYQFQRGQVVRGKAFSYESDGVFVDIGGKSAAFLPAEEASLRRITDLSQTVPLQEEREFLIIREQDGDGQVTLSIRQLEIRQLWQRLAEMQEENQTVQVRVSGVNKGGVTVDVQGIRGFIPRSHLIDRENLDALIGKALTVSILEVNPAAKKLVLSNRLAAQAASFGQLAEGQLIEGKITGIRPFGVFVDFSGTTGLLHINQVSKNYVASLDAVFQIGQTIKAVIIEIDDIKRRISLSTKVLESYPGEMLEKMSEVMAEASTRLQTSQQVAASSKSAGASAAEPEENEISDEE